MEIQNQKQHDLCLSLVIKITYENKLVCLSNLETWFSMFQGCGTRSSRHVIHFKVIVPLNVPYVPLLGVARRILGSLFFQIQVYYRHREVSLDIITIIQLYLMRNGENIVINTPNRKYKK